MPITLIACVVHYKNKLAIGRNNNLLLKLKKDMEFFKNMTSGDHNVVVMGRKTWFSLPRSHRPLPNRLNIVLTNDKDLQRLSPFPWQWKVPFAPITPKKNVYFMNYKQFLHFYANTNSNVFVIGGANVYNQFLNNPFLSPQKIYLTEVKNYKFEKHLEPDTFMDAPDERYTLTNVSNQIYDEGYQTNYRILTYENLPQLKSQEHKYLDFCKSILKNGENRPDRTGTGIISTFGHQIHFDISENVPLFTTKRVAWKHVIEELLWFCRGDTDNKVLQNKGIKIWDGNTSRQFLDSRGLYDYYDGVGGPIYGFQMRFFGAKYSQSFADTSQVDITKIGGFDQLNYVVNELKNNPYSRRILMCYWNPPDMSKMVLAPCHYSCQFYVDNSKSLNCHFTMRSNDMFLGCPFNIFSYAVLTYIIAIKCDLKPGKLIYTVGDAHIYTNHIEQMREQITRTPRPLPKLILNPDIQKKDWSEITIEDFELVGYMPHPSIQGKMAV
jgi:dihydrofolate reductase/thymidylate synthase